jgi:ribosomal protein S27AE
MSFIKGRLRSLEEAIRGARRCPECGLSSRDPEAQRRIVTTYEEDDEGRLEEALAEVCEECGRPEVIHIRMVYDR